MAAEYCCREMSLYANQQQREGFSYGGIKLNPDGRTEGYYIATDVQFGSYSEYTQYTDEIWYPTPIKYCPWCGSRQPGDQERY